MDRTVLFALGIIIGILFLIQAVLYLTGHSFFPPSGVHIKHAIGFAVIGVVALLFAAANRPQSAVVS